MKIPQFWRDYLWGLGVVARGTLVAIAAFVLLVLVLGAH